MHIGIRAVGISATNRLWLNRLGNSPTVPAQMQQVIRLEVAVLGLMELVKIVRIRRGSAARLAAAAVHHLSGVGDARSREEQSAKSSMSQKRSSKLVGLLGSKRSYWEP